VWAFVEFTVSFDVRVEQFPSEFWLMYGDMLRGRASGSGDELLSHVLRVILITVKSCRR